MNILIVENEALVALQIESFVIAAGHAVVGIADTVASALALVTGQRPDIALVDMNLAEGDNGLTLAAHLHAMAIPVLLATGNCPTETPGNVAVGCLSKPFDCGELLNALRIVDQITAGTLVDPPPLSLRLFAQVA